MKKQETPNEVIEAFNHVKKHFPTVAIVIYNNQSQWQFMDENFDSFIFDDKIDVNILNDAADSLIELPFIYQK